MRANLTERLSQELTGGGEGNGPVIFEIPLEGSDRYDVIVVWDEWGQQSVPGEIRSEIIASAYERVDSPIAKKLAIAIGATNGEAVEQNLLPYSIVPMVRKGKADAASIQEAMLRHGAIRVSGNTLELRLPTLKLAEQVHRQIVDELPNGYWAIVQKANTAE